MLLLILSLLLLLLLLLLEVVMEIALELSCLSSALDEVLIWKDICSMVVAGSGSRTEGKAGGLRCDMMREEEERDVR